MPPNQEPITIFRGQHFFLSNFSNYHVLFAGKGYKTLEHAFQAAKTLDPDIRAQIQQAITPAEAKRLGRRVLLREGWEDLKESVMLHLLRTKFNPAANRSAAHRLLFTGQRPLLEGNDWGDHYWGVNQFTLKGQNRLGVLLMQVREETGPLWHLNYGPHAIQEEEH